MVMVTVIVGFIGKPVQVSNSDLQGKGFIAWRFVIHIILYLTGAFALVDLVNILFSTSAFQLHARVRFCCI